MKNFMKKVLEKLELFKQYWVWGCIPIFILCITGVVIFISLILFSPLDTSESTASALETMSETMSETTAATIQTSIPEWTLLPKTNVTSETAASPETIAEVETTAVSDNEWVELGTYSDFSLMYLQNSSEFVCVRDDEEIGRRVYVDSVELVRFLNYLSSEDYKLGYFSDEKLIYPIFIKDIDGNVSFYLYTIETFEEDPSEVFAGYFDQARYSNFDYHIYNGKVYYIKNADDYKFESKTFGSKHYLPIVDEYIALTIAELNEYALGKTLIFNSTGGGPITACTEFNNSLLLYTDWPESPLSAKEMRSEGLFEKYATDSQEGFVCDTWFEAQEVVKYIDDSCIDETSSEKAEVK